MNTQIAAKTIVVVSDIFSKPVPQEYRTNPAKASGIPGSAGKKTPTSPRTKRSPLAIGMIMSRGAIYLFLIKYVDEAAKTAQTRRTAA